MSAQRLALQTLKSIEATSQTRSAFKFSRVSNLAKLVRVLGYGFLLFDLSPMAAQTLALTENKGVQGTISPSVRETPTNHRKIELRGITGKYYTMRNGETCEVWQHTDGRLYVVRSNRRKYFPKSLNDGRN